VPRRPDPARIEQARRIATLNRVIADGVSATEAEAWLVAWEARAARYGREQDGRYWEAGWSWIAAQREHLAASQGGGPARPFGDAP
jgi:hypothetical protein